MQNMEWFHSLNKPFLSPPDWIFVPVWSVLYVLMVLSFIFFIKGGMNKNKRLPLIFFIIQLALNLAWSPVFFGMQNILGALIIIVFMWLFTLLTIVYFLRHSILASILLIPYLIWISFAFYLNFGFYVLN